MFRREAKLVGLWRIDADTLAGSRFVVSPLAEATASLIALATAAAPHPGQRAWLDAHLPAYRELLAAEPITELLVRAQLGRHWIADFLCPAPSGEADPDFSTELTRIRDTPPETAQADIAVALGRPVPDRLKRPDLPQRASDLLGWVWQETVLPYWPSRRRILEADVVARTRRLSQGGWATALDDIRPGTRWLGGGRLQINAYDYPPREICGAELLFVPVTPRQGWAAWEEPHRYALIYPCSGVLADPDPWPAAGALARLLGRGRARVLLRLDSPKSTTQLVALTGQGLGSVGRHLKILLDARLIERRRAGRSVLYYRTTAGDALVRAQDPASDR
jgi:DNA-binding transcriptional ArsR family regulator